MSAPNAYEVLGRHIVGHYEAAALQEMLGADAASTGAFNWSMLVNAAAEAANQGIAYDASKKAASAASDASNAAAAKSIAADAAWASAEQQLILAQQHQAQMRMMSAMSGTGVSSQQADQALVAPQILVTQTAQASMAAGAGLSADAQNKRMAAAQKAATNAAGNATAHPDAGDAVALAQAWQKVLAGVSMGGAAGGGGSGGGALTRLIAATAADGGGSWFTAKHAGLPGWAWVATGVTVPTLLVFIIRALRK